MQSRHYLELNERLQEARIDLTRRRDELRMVGESLEQSVAAVKGRALWLIMCSWGLLTSWYWLTTWNGLYGDLIVFGNTSEPESVHWRYPVACKDILKSTMNCKTFPANIPGPKAALEKKQKKLFIFMLWGIDIDQRLCVRTDRVLFAHNYTTLHQQKLSLPQKFLVISFAITAY